MSNKYPSSSSSTTSGQRKKEDGKDYKDKDKVVLLPLATIFNKFDVRLELDQDRVIQFAAIYESQGDDALPPIEVVAIDEDTYAFIDGRTRAAARAYIDLTTVPAIVRNGNLRDDPAALYARALEANWGGAKPPTRADIEHTILRMLEAGVSRTEVKEILVFLPQGSLRAYLANALSTLSKRRIGRALDAINEGATIEQAARQNQLKGETLKDIVAGKKGQWGKSRTSEVEIITEVKSYISRISSTPSKGIGGKIAVLLQQVEDGEVSAKGAAQAIDHWKGLIRKTSLRIADWEARLESIQSAQLRASGQEPAPKIEIEAPKAKVNGHANGHTNAALHVPKLKRSREDAISYVGERMGQGFWNEELPKAIKVTGAKTAAQLIEYFQGEGKIFTIKQVDGALQRLRKRGMNV
jgi:hypothetical protein